MKQINTLLATCLMGVSVGVSGQTSPPSGNPNLRLTCSVSAEVTNIQCHDNGTAVITADDFITFDLKVDGVGTGAGWVIDHIGDNPGLSGNYGEMVAVGPCYSSLTNIELEVHDHDDAACFTSVSIPNPGSCSDAGDCHLEVEISNLIARAPEPYQRYKRLLFDFSVSGTGLPPQPGFDHWVSYMSGGLNPDGAPDYALATGWIPSFDTTGSVFLPLSSDTAYQRFYIPGTNCEVTIPIVWTFDAIPCELKYQPGEFVCGRQTAAGFEVATRRDSIYQLYTLDIQRQIIGQNTLPAPPRVIQKVENGNLVTKNLNLQTLESIPIPSDKLTAYAKNIGTFSRDPSGGWWLGLVRTDAPVIELIRTDNGFDLTQSIVLPGHPANDKVLLIRHELGGGLFVGLSGYSPGSATRIFRLDATGVVTDSFRIEENVLSIEPSPCGEPSVFLIGTDNTYNIITPGGSVDLKKSQSLYSIRLQGNGPEYRSTETKTALFQNGLVTYEAHSRNLAENGDSLKYHYVQTREGPFPGNQFLINTLAGLERRSPDGSLIWSESLPPEFPGHTFFQVFESGTDAAVLWGEHPFGARLWSLEVPCLVNGTAGAPDDSASAFRLMPNPAAERVRVQVDKPLPAQLTLFNGQGQPVLTRTLSTPVSEFDVSVLPDGVYIAVLENAGGWKRRYPVKLVVFRSR